MTAIQPSYDIQFPSPLLNSINEILDNKIPKIKSLQRIFPESGVPPIANNSQNASSSKEFNFFRQLLLPRDIQVNILNQGATSLRNWAHLSAFLSPEARGYFAKNHLHTLKQSSYFFESSIQSSEKKLLQHIFTLLVLNCDRWELQNLIDCKNKAAPYINPTRAQKVAEKIGLVVGFLIQSPLILWPIYAFSFLQAARFVIITERYLVANYSAIFLNFVADYVPAILVQSAILINSYSVTIFCFSVVALRASPQNSYRYKAYCVIFEYVMFPFLPFRIGYEISRRAGQTTKIGAHLINLGIEKSQQTRFRRELNQVCDLWIKEMQKCKVVKKSKS